MSTALYEVRDGVAVITLNNPPVNSLAHAHRVSIVANVERAETDPAVVAIVLIGAGNAFCGGAEIREFNTPTQTATPNSREVIARVEASKKPVVAAVHKVAMGGGLELALGCHYRVCAPGAQIALPEVKLGILPGAGGTQRLPRAVGVATALQMIVSGDPMLSEKIAPLGLFSEVIVGDLLTGAVAFAKRMAAARSNHPRLRDDRPHTIDAHLLFNATRERLRREQRGFPAPLKCVDAVEASISTPLDEGLAFERTLFMELVETTESKALRHAFFAERAAAKVPDVPENTPVIELKTIAVLGAGTMGGGIAMALANAGYAVRMLDAKPDALERGIATIRKNYAATVLKGRLTQDAMDKRMTLIRPAHNYTEIRDCDLVIEAVFERMDVKKAVFRELDAAMKPTAILATNTSTLDVNEIATAVKNPERVIGLHFFSPANVMRLLEIVRGAKTAKPVLATALALSKKIRKVGVVSGVCDGFIGNRMLEEYVRQSLFLLEEGATPWQIDRAIERFGFAMGPFRMYDMAGNDIGYEVRKRRRVERPNETYPAIADRVVELGRVGQKAGKGFYDYPGGSRNAVPSAEVEQLILDYSKEIGLARRVVADDEIVERCIYALVNTGAKILEEGIALRASDIDMVYLTGYGFPLYRGGPMFYANTVGLKIVATAMERYRKGRNGQYWEPAKLLAQHAVEHKNF
ncbi:MAG: 3-hydroxyacyl-CoA dehydrogenase NAD-binding domain-containing protein [Burkholderiales bacterium]